jgi:hypothetical protein
MSTAKWTLRPSLMRRAILGTQAAGLEVERVDFDPATGRISVIPKGATDKSAPNGNEWDDE